MVFNNVKACLRTTKMLPKGGSGLLIQTQKLKIASKQVKTDHNIWSGLNNLFGLINMSDLINWSGLISWSCLVNPEDQKNEGMVSSANLLKLDFVVFRRRH